MAHLKSILWSAIFLADREGGSSPLWLLLAWVLVVVGSVWTLVDIVQRGA